MTAAHLSITITCESTTDGEERCTSQRGLPSAQRRGEGLSPKGVPSPRRSVVSSANSIFESSVLPQGVAYHRRSTSACSSPKAPQQSSAGASPRGKMVSQASLSAHEEEATCVIGSVADGRVPLKSPRGGCAVHSKQCNGEESCTDALPRFSRIPSFANKSEGELSSEGETSRSSMMMMEDSKLIPRPTVLTVPREPTVARVASPNATASNQSSRAPSPMPVSTSFSRTATNSDERVEMARVRMLQIRQQEMREKERAREESQVRQDDARSRKALLDSQEEISRAIAWRSVISAAHFCVQLRCEMNLARHRAYLHHRFFPVLQLQLHRWLRSVRCRLNHHPKPTPLQLKQDRTLSLFSDEHLDYLCSRAEKKYFFANETIVFMGLADEREAFVLMSGSASVVVNRTKVFTLAAVGSVFGTIGMISGEPRTASVIAATECFTWVLHKDDFDSFAMNQTSSLASATAHCGDSATTKAFAILSELRTSNIRTVYKSQYTPEYLSSFSAFSGVAMNTLGAIVDSGYGTVLRPQTIMARPLVGSAAADDVSRSVHLVLRGSVEVSWDANKKGGLASLQERNQSLEEALHLLIQFPKQFPQTFVVRSTAADGVISVVKGPLLLNISAALGLAWLPFVVTAASTCDAIAFRRQSLLDQDILELESIRSNCTQLRAPFIEVPSPAQMAKSIVLRPSSMSSSRHKFCSLREDDVVRWAARLPLIPMVIRMDHVCSVFDQSDASSFQDVFLIVRGKVEVQPIGKISSSSNSTAQVLEASGAVSSFLFPELPFAYFGCVPFRLKALTAVDALKIKRDDLQQWLKANTGEAERRALLQSFGACVESITLRCAVMVATASDVKLSKAIDCDDYATQVVDEVRCDYLVGSPLRDRACGRLRPSSARGEAATKEQAGIVPSSRTTCRSPLLPPTAKSTPETLTSSQRTSSNVPMKHSVPKQTGCNHGGTSPLPGSPRALSKVNTESDFRSRGTYSNATSRPHTARGASSSSAARPR